MWDARYAEADYAYGTAPNDFLVERVADLTPGRCLCLAEGQGRNAVWLAQHGFDVTAVDQSPVGLERARELATERGVEIATRAVDLADYDMGTGVWDSVVAIFAHLPPRLRRNVHARVVRALKPGGTVLLEAYTPDKYTQPGQGGPPPSQKDWTMTREGLLAEFAGLEPICAEEVVREITEGEYHRGQSAVVRFLARKP